MAELARLVRLFRGKSKWELDTPCLVIDSAKLDHNLRVMQEFAQKRGKQVRPHCKSHKCSALAHRQMEAGAVGVCVAKVSEAAVLVEKGVGKVLVTSPVVTPLKMAELIRLSTLSADVAVVVDREENAVDLDRLAGQAGVRLKVLVEIESGQRRTGATVGDAVALCERVNTLPSLEFLGVQRYAGHVQHIKNYAERSSVSLAIMREGAEVVRKLRAQGLPAHIFTGTGSGTYDIDTEVPELTDIQTGSYCVMDAEYKNIASKDSPIFSSAFSPQEPPMTLLATVISAPAKPELEGFVTVDAGLKALYKDGDTPEVIHPANATFTYQWAGDEHGRIVFDPKHDAAPRVGQVIELIVSHCDPTINLFDYFFVTTDGVVTDIWPIDLRGKCQ